MIRITDTAFRVTILVLAAIAVLSFSYNQVAQARAVRYHALGEGARLVVDTWTDRLCLFAGRCYPIVRDSAPPPAIPKRYPPAVMDTMDTTP